MFQFLRNYNTKRNKNPLCYRSEVLEEMIRNITRDCNPLLRPYSAEELSLATHSFQCEIHSDANYTLYEGIHRDRKIYVKKFTLRDFHKEFAVLQMIANEFWIPSMMSNHPNVLKLLGFCLETELPVLIYEFPENGNLCTSLFRNNQLSWDQKMKIVIEIANSVAYLHHGLPNAYIHCELKPGNIFLDRNFSPKLFQFYYAIMIPQGQTDASVDIIQGTLGFMDPEVYSNHRYTQKSDVYVFGILLCEILTEERYITLLDWIEDESFDESGMERGVERFCPVYFRDERIRVQVMEYVKLVKRCLKFNSADRPGMIEAEMELRRIKNLSL